MKPYGTDIHIASSVKCSDSLLKTYGGNSKMTITSNDDNGTTCTRTDTEEFREKLRQRIYPRIETGGRGFSFKEIGILRNSVDDMSRVPLIGEDGSTTETDPCNMVVLEAGIPGDTWSYCVERERLASRSEWFRAMLVGPLAPAPRDPPPLLKLQHVEKRAFDCLLRYLHDEPINFQSVATARATLDAAHQYLCPELARLSVRFLESNLDSSTALEIYHGLSLYANHPTSGLSASSSLPTAPPAPGDDAGEIAAACTGLLVSCLTVIDREPSVAFNQERFEELSAQEVSELARREALRLTDECVLFSALDRWSSSECRRHGLEPSAMNRRSALPDEVWYSVRYPLMTDREFVEGPMASGILSSEEAAFIVARILGHSQGRDEEVRSPSTGPLSKLSSTPRIGTRTCGDECHEASGPGKKEQQDNRKNRRKECATQGHRTCVRIGNCLVRVLACVFD